MSLQKRTRKNLSIETKLQLLADVDKKQSTKKEMAEKHGEIALLVIGKSLTPRCMKNVKNLPVEYTANKKAWLTGAIFENWLQKLDRKFLLQGRSTAMVVDNCPAHPNIDDLRSIKLVFFAAKCHLQPCDQAEVSVSEIVQTLHSQNEPESDTDEEPQIEETEKKVTPGEARAAIATLWRFAEQQEKGNFLVGAFLAEKAQERGQELQLAREKQEAELQLLRKRRDFELRLGQEEGQQQQEGPQCSFMLSEYKSLLVTNQSTFFKDHWNKTLFLNINFVTDISI
ncbi:tigger transposable element-derived protein [Plakobranchus ocellatus]|uniref:Tigger transposable element-derived protein n=1 Tax=Plakobranchus ocellatus TaxID=259542 RepID=A0AAV4BM68_9GAST|nr:tigger transposable element-derived protein [Plakobranchus ocellatus]